VLKSARQRQQADLCRQIADIPTEGGRREDRVLVTIADKLERQAAALDQLNVRALIPDEHLS